jgi:PAS domain S-box-containing protein
VKNFKKISVKFLLVIFLLNINLYTQTQRRIFESITIEDGLSQNSVSAILQDKYGEMWFGTEAGLDKYDGYNITSYKNNPENPTSISNNWINCLLEDINGNIWVGTAQGLNYLNRNSDEFIRYYQNGTEPYSIHGSTINTIFTDSKNNIWVGTDKGLNKYDSLNKNFSFIQLNPINTNQNKFHVYAIYEDKNGIIWIGTENDGLYKYDIEISEITNFKHDTDNSNSINSNSVRFISGDNNENIWIGFENNGLDKFDLNKNKFSHYQYSQIQVNSPSSNRLRTAYNEEDKTLWIGTIQGGLNKFDFSTESFTAYAKNPSDLRSLNNNSVLSICKDNTGILWIGTSGGGVSKSKDSWFQHIKNETNNQKSLSSNLVWSFTEDKKGNIFVGTSQGLNKLDNQGKFVESIFSIPGNNKSLSSNSVWSISADDRNNLWIGTSDGLNKYDLNSRNIERIYLEEQEFRGFTRNRITALFFDSHKTLWVGSQNGLYTFDRTSKKWEYYIAGRTEDGKINSGQISSIIEDEHQNIWIGTRDNGLNKYNRKIKKFVSYVSELNDSNSLSSKEVQSITADQNGNLWIGTSQGLNKFNIKTEKNYQYKSADGLLDEVIYGLVADNENNIWAGTTLGICKLNFQTNTFKNFTIHDGLQSNEFNINAAYKLKDGRILFGGINGFNIFNPDQLKSTLQIPSVKFTSLTEFGKDDIRSKPIYELEALRFSYDENYFTIEFAIFDYSNPAKNSFQYMLAGLKNRWIDLGNKRSITFTNLAPGEYSLMVKGKNSEGVPTSKNTEIKIIVEPPFWATWWFRVFAAIIILLLISHIYIYRVRKIKSLNKRLEKLISNKTRDLILTNSQLEHAKDELAIEKEELATTLKSIADGVISTDRDGKILLVNKAAEETFGKTANSLIGSFIQKEICIKNESKVGAEMHKVNTSTKDFLNALETDTVLLEVKGNKTKLVQFNSSQILTGNNTYCGFVIVFKDVTEKINTENQIAVMQKMESIGHLAAGIAHEINTPMQYVGDNTSFLKDSFGSFLEFINSIIPDVSNSEKPCSTKDKIIALKEKLDIDFLVAEIPLAIEQSQVGIEKVSKIVRAMKDFSHPGNKEKSYNDINRGIEVTSTISKNEWKYVAEFETDLDSSLPNVYCLQDELNQVILNMIVNAAHAIAEKTNNGKEGKGKIKIATKQEDNYAIITISDTGKGIKSENLDKIFDPFFTTKKVGKGTGQGLSIVHDIIVNKHSGFINVNSVLDKGTIFKIKLPICQDGKFPT